MCTHSSKEVGHRTNSGRCQRGMVRVASTGDRVRVGKESRMEWDSEEGWSREDEAGD